MKKTLLAAAAVAALGTVAGAQAQTNVTIYGVADAGISRFDNGRDTTTGLQSGGHSGSRIGFRGTEDLGGGLSAIFTLETGFNIDDGTLGQSFTNASGARQDRLFGRQAFVGLAGGFGQIKLGRQYNPIRVAVESVDPFGLGLAGNANNMIELHGERADNTINYTTPNLGGFSGQLAYSLGEFAGDNSRARQVGVSVGYAAGPFSIVLAHHDQNLESTPTSTAPATPSGEMRTTMLGGTYDFQVAKLHAAWSRNKRENNAGVTTIDRDDVMLGVSAPVGAAGTVLASWIRRSDDVRGTRDTSRDADQWAIGYIHNLSKRTNLYTSYARIKNDAGASAGFGSSFTVAGAGRDPSLFNVGIRHRF